MKRSPFDSLLQGSIPRPQPLLPLLPRNTSRSRCLSVVFQKFSRDETNVNETKGVNPYGCGSKKLTKKQLLASIGKRKN